MAATRVPLNSRLRKRAGAIIGLLPVRSARRNNASITAPTAKPSTAGRRSTPAHPR